MSEKKIPYIQVNMIRQDMRDIPQYELPDRYRMRDWRRGDRETWLRVWKASERLRPVTDETFDSSFGADLAAMKKRCRFLVSPDGEDVGTITAWYDRNYRGRRWGRIHWVAIHPDHRGLRLSKPLMTAGMNRMRSLGHRRAMLTTQTPRIAAIKTYLDFGFVPDMTTADAYHAWRVVRDLLPHPAVEEAVEGRFFSDHA